MLQPGILSFKIKVVKSASEKASHPCFNFTGGVFDRRRGTGLMGRYFCSYADYEFYVDTITLYELVFEDEYQLNLLLANWIETLLTKEDEDGDTYKWFDPGRYNFHGNEGFLFLLLGGSDCYKLLRLKRSCKEIRSCEEKEEIKEMLVVVNGVESKIHELLREMLKEVMATYNGLDAAVLRFYYMGNQLVILINAIISTSEENYALSLHLIARLIVKEAYKPVVEFSYQLPNVWNSAVLWSVRILISQLWRLWSSPTENYNWPEILVKGENLLLGIEIQVVLKLGNPEWRAIKLQQKLKWIVQGASYQSCTSATSKIGSYQVVQADLTVIAKSFVPNKLLKLQEGVDFLKWKFKSSNGGEEGILLLTAARVIYVESLMVIVDRQEGNELQILLNEFKFLLVPITPVSRISRTRFYLSASCFFLHFYLLTSDACESFSFHDKVLMAVKLYSWSSLHTLHCGWYVVSLCNQLICLYKNDSIQYCHMCYNCIWGLEYQTEMNSFAIASQLVNSREWKVTANFYAKRPAI